MDAYKHGIEAEPVLKENEPQIKAPRVTPLEGVYTYCSAIRGRGVENPQGFGMMNADLMNR